MKKFLIIVCFLASTSVFAQRITITGIVTDENGSSLPGATVQVKGTAEGTTTDVNGKYSLDVSSRTITLVFSFVGYITQEIPVQNQNVVNASLAPDILGLQEVIVVGYGTQKRSDITGTVASISSEKLEATANVNIAQAIQGSVPGVMIQTTESGAEPSTSIMIRGRNSILASNDPLIVLDGIPYGGNLADINLNDIQSVEVLKDASAAAIYGSRGANGVILITSKQGSVGKPVITYDGKYSIQQVIKLPDMLNGDEFYDFKKMRSAAQITQEETEIHDAGTWVNYMDLAIRTGSTQEHNVSVAGGTQNVKYFIGGGLLDTKGVNLNDEFQRISTRANIETKITDWLSLGTRTQLTLDNADGAAADGEEDIYDFNPLSRPYDADGNLTIFPAAGKLDGNPLQPILWIDRDRAYQVISNNYAIIDFPFVKGLSYRINTGLRFKFSDQAQYRGTDTQEGYQLRGTSETNRGISNNTVIENIFSFNRDFGDHTLFATALYSYEGNKSSSNSLEAQGFPNDFLIWNASAQAELITPDYSDYETALISQMVRLNYSYGSRYLLTLTARRDGFSGFGSKKKWGVFPSVALGWNLANERFFPLKDIFSELKLRVSIGLNGNQAVGAYETISRLTEENMVSGTSSVPGYIPSKLGQDDLGWESSRVLNLGGDFGLLENRFSVNVNWYLTNTFDLLLDRTISPVHGVTSITQNIGETQNKGLEISLNSRNIVNKDFKWSTSANLSFNKNKIVSLYGSLDDEGNEIDDLANKWFIGKPIRINYNYVFDGIWQTEEAEEAAKWKTKPGYVKLKDIDGNYKLDGEDRQIIGQLDPKFLWGLTNTLSYKNLTFSFFMHGVHGITKEDELMEDDHVHTEIRHTTMRKNWWTPDNPSNDFWMNADLAERMAGITATIYENASFVRVKDVSLSYDFSKSLIGKASLSRLRLFITGRNLLTFTEWSGTDPELESQLSRPMQKEYVFGLNLGF